MIITIGGGKGGTGKSFVATNLAFTLSKLGQKVLLVDADVESPVDHLLLSIKRREVDRIRSFLPRIIPEKCTKCNLCVESCPEHALLGVSGKIPILLKDLCDGCYVCKLVCPVDAIGEDHRDLGAIYCGSNYGIDLLQGEIFPGVKQSANVVKKLIDLIDGDLSSKYDFIVIDSAPGTGAMLWLTIRISSLVVGVTEPTPLGVSDLNRFLSLVRSLDKHAIVVINKSNIEGGVKNRIYEIASGFDVFEIPYSEEALRYYLRGKIVAAESKYMNNIFSELTKKILSLKSELS